MREWDRSTSRRVAQRKRIRFTGISWSGCSGKSFAKLTICSRGEVRFYGDVQFKDYYAILGVPKTASQDEIRKAFRKLAREFHPDVAKDKKAAEAKFKEI